MSDLKLQVPYVKNLTYEQYNAALLERDAEIEQMRVRAENLSRLLRSAADDAANIAKLAKICGIDG